jgi:hypothetical protein
MPRRARRRASLCWCGCLGCLHRHSQSLADDDADCPQDDLEGKQPAAGRQPARKIGDFIAVGFEMLFESEAHRAIRLPHILQALLIVCGEQRLPVEGETSSWGSRIQMALPTQATNEIIARTPHGSREPWPALTTRKAPAIDAAASTVPARVLNPNRARSCSASALAVDSKLSFSMMLVWRNGWACPAMTRSRWLRHELGDPKTLMP